jgi:predicted amidohydrolase
LRRRQVARIKAAFVQTKPVFGRVKENVEAAVRQISRLRMDGGVVVLPELFSTGYQFRSRAEARRHGEDARKGYAPQRLAETAAKYGLYIVAGMAERAGGAGGAGDKVYNSSVLVGPKGVIGVYRKAHLFWNELNIFSKGNTRFRVHDIGGARVGMMICFDWFFPEAARTLALKGAEIICHPSNLVLPYCPQAMITRCLENRVFAVTANRVGVEERARGTRLKFIGSSQVVSPRGEILVRASRGRTGAKVVEIDTELARRKDVTPLNDALRDRRPGLYEL